MARKLLGSAVFSFHTAKPMARAVIHASSIFYDEFMTPNTFIKTCQHF